MSDVRRIDDGFACTVACGSGLLEIQLAEESRSKGMWELFVSKGEDGTLDGLSADDLTQLGAAIVNLASTASVDRKQRLGLPANVTPFFCPDRSGKR